MIEAQLRGVKKRTAELSDPCAQFLTFDCIRSATIVDRVCDNWMVDMGEMDADLMCPSGLDLQVEQCEKVESFGYPIERQRMSTLSFRPHGHFDAASRMAAYWCFDSAFICPQAAEYQCLITLVNRP